jgi:hypothetical protein
MTRILNAAIVLGLSATAAFTLGGGHAKPAATSEPQFAADGAFRDGLYLGHLAREHGQAMRPAIGRWSTEHDRAMFREGYQRGYEVNVH